jgi:hypothetical protein
MAGGDIESGGVGVTAEPDNCGRIRVTFAVGLAPFTLVGSGFYLIGPEMFEDGPLKPVDNMFAFVAGIVCLIFGCCFFILFGGLMQEWELGHPVEHRLVDKLMM